MNQFMICGHRGEKSRGILNIFIFRNMKAWLDMNLHFDAKHSFQNIHCS